LDYSLSVLQTNIANVVPLMDRFSKLLNLD
jgi:hypothetical protein